MCVVCGEEADQTTIPCGHTCTCITCAARMMGEGWLRATRAHARNRGVRYSAKPSAKCPQCNRPAEGFMRVQKPMPYEGYLAPTVAERRARREAKKLAIENGIDCGDGKEEEPNEEEEGDRDVEEEE